MPVRIVERRVASIVPDMHLLRFHKIVPAGMAIGKKQICPPGMPEMQQLIVRIGILLKSFILFPVKTVITGINIDRIAEKIQL